MQSFNLTQLCTDASLRAVAPGERNHVFIESVRCMQCDDHAYAQNEQMLERLMAVDDVDHVHTNCEGLT